MILEVLPTLVLHKLRTQQESRYPMLGPLEHLWIIFRNQLPNDTKLVILLTLVSLYEVQVRLTRTKLETTVKVAPNDTILRPMLWSENVPRLMPSQKPEFH